MRPPIQAALTSALIFLGHQAAPAKPSAKPRPAADPFHWYTYTVDSGSEKGTARMTSNTVRVDPDGGIKLGYRGKLDAKYAELKDHRWTKEVVDTGSGSIAKLDFDVDPSGNPHILFQTWDYKRVRYAVRRNGTWRKREIAQLNLPNLDFYQVSLIAPDTGGAQMVFTAAHEGWASATYTKVDAEANTLDSSLIIPELSGKWNSLAADSKGSPVVSFFIFDRSRLGVAWREGGEWKVQTVDTATRQRHGYFNSIVRKDDSTYMIVFLNQDGKQISLATGRPGGAWTVERVDTAAAWTVHSTQIRIALGSDGEPVVAYPEIENKSDAEASKSRLYLATRKNGAWEKQVVDSNGIAGEFASLAMLPGDLPVLSYWEAGQKHLRVSVASKTAPPDENNNGIPDYKEVTGIRKRIRLPNGRRSELQYDAAGRTLAASSLPAQQRRAILQGSPSGVRLGKNRSRKSVVN